MRYVKYFFAQLKRILRLAVGTFPTAMLLFACLAMTAYYFLWQGPFSDTQQKYQIGIVGNIEESYLGFGIYAIRTLDTTRFLIDFIPMEEDEAKEAFRNGEVVAYLIVPDDFLESIIYGRNDVPIRYVTSEGQKGLDGYVMEELADVASRLVTTSQASIYSMQEVARRAGQRDNIRAWTNELNAILISYVLSRTDFAEVEEIGYGGGLNVKQYYFCTVLLLFCFLFGISCAPYFLRKNQDVGKWMRIRGIGPAAQVACEYMVYFLFMTLCTFAPLAVLNVMTKGMSFLGGRIWLEELFKAILPITFLASSLHFMVGETIKNPVANLLFQFLGALGMGYVSGYVYPSSFFPKGIAAVGDKLPTGIALDYFSKTVFGKGYGKMPLLLIAYAAVFLVISVVVRKWSIERENG